MREIVIPKRFNGPPASANGGYTCGLVAQLLGGGPAEVRLRRPPPLEVALRWDGTRLLDGEDVVAEGHVPAAEEQTIDLVEPATYEEAQEATARYPGRHDHPFPTCFTCGPDRAADDGLRIFPGPVSGRDIVASPWVPHPSLQDETGTVPIEIIWAALDCTGGWAGLSRFEGTFVLGTMRGAAEGPTRAGVPHVATGWLVAGEGRKLHCGSALHTATGELLGWSAQVWIRAA